MQKYPLALGNPDPVFCVVVDVEEEFDWHGPFKQENTNVEAVEYLNLAHTLLTSLSVKPAYLVTYAVATSPTACRILRDYLARDTCDIGAQLHPWVTPPHEEVKNIRNSYPSNLPVDLARRKLESLIAAITENIGCQPRIYKAGRYGLDLARVSTLADLGFWVDTSVMPYADFKDIDGGPDFFGMPDQPFWLTEDRRLLGLPSTQGIVRPLSELASTKLLRAIFSGIGQTLHLPGILARLGLVERLRLSPEGFNFEHCRYLIDSNISRGKNNFILSFHIPSLMLGCTPYVQSPKDLRNFLETLYSVSSYLVDKIGAKPISVIDLYKKLH